MNLEIILCKILVKIKSHPKIEFRMTFMNYFKI